MSKVPVVDDAADILTVVEIILTMQKIVVKTISREEDIQSSIQTFSPDFILPDVAPGNAEGKEKCKKLKAWSETGNLPVILFWAHYKHYNLTKNVEDFRAVYLITKPFEASYLVKAIRKNIA